MVTLNKIYTRTGDDGYTKLGNGKTVGKDYPVIEAYATVDELNAHIGLLESNITSSEIVSQLHKIMQDLFEVGADICTESEDRIAEKDVEKLENWIDEINEDLEPLTSFVLPAGSQTVCQCHVARTVCRRAERRLVECSRSYSPIDIAVLRNWLQNIKYLNRLSDYLFVLARSLSGGNEILWEPRQK